MADESFYSANVEDVKGWLEGDGEFVPPSGILADLTEEQVTIVPTGSPYSIAQIVAHMQYFQGRGLAKRRGESLSPKAEHLIDTFAPPGPGGWEKLRSDFLAGIQELKAMAGDKVDYGYVSVSLHNAYHLGEIVMLRHLLGLWPPTAGEDYDF